MNQYISKLLANKTNNLFVQLFRYTFVGGIAFVIDFGLLFLLTAYAGLHYQWSAAISFIAGLAVNYMISITWVFNADEGSRNRLYEFLMFAVVGVIGLGLNALIIYVFTELVGVYYLISKIISTIIVFLWNFLGRRYLLLNFIKICHKIRK
jgi:putative flippase GtrA